MRKDKPSTTARKVALNTVSLGAYRKTAGILPDGLADAAAEILLKSGAQGAIGVRISRSPKIAWLYKAFDWMMPGQFEAFAHRKAFCEEQVRESIAAGAEQVLVLGAGYDMIGWRLAPEFPDVSFFEIDHPATARLKAKGIEVMGARSNLHLLAEDLSQVRLIDVLTAAPAWDHSLASIIIAEGLLMYLPPEAVEDLLAQCGAVSGPGSRMAFSYVGTRMDGRPDAGPWTGLVLWILKKTGEPWLWSIRPDELGLFLKQNGWRPDRSEEESWERHGVEFYGAAVR